MKKTDASKYCCLDCQDQDGKLDVRFVTGAHKELLLWQRRLMTR